jgi:anti-sigma regulatory factor (Ser/Thr protein kinase)
MVVGTTCLELVLPALPGSVRRARGAVGETVEDLAEGNRLADDVRLCVSEAVSNVVRHAYAGKPRGDVVVVVEADGDELSVVVRDTGTGMTPARRRAKAAGYGLKIIEKITSRCEIRSASGVGTEVRMKFLLAPPLDRPYHPGT